MTNIKRLKGYAFAKKKGDDIYVFEEGQQTLGDETPVIAEGSTVPRLLKDRFVDVVNVKDFGAKGDGVTDDTEAIARAFANIESKTLFFPAGVYLISSLSPKANFTMDKGAVLKFSGENKAETFIVISQDNLSIGCVNVDFDNKEIVHGFSIDGNNNNIDEIHVYNLSSEEVLTVGVHVTGNNNSINNLFIDDFINKGYWNDSSPQGLTLNGSATGNTFDNIESHNARSTVVNNSTGNNNFGNVYSYDCHDNGFYAVAAGTSIVGTIYYDGTDNGVGFRHGANAIIGSVLISKALNPAIFFGDCGNVSIGFVSAKNCGTLFYINEADTGELKIGTVFAEIKDGYPIYLPDSNGTVRAFSVQALNCKVLFTDPSTLSNNIFIRLDACEEVNIYSANIDIILDDGLTSPMFVYGVFPEEVKYPSTLGTIQARFFKSDGVTLSDAGDILFFRNVGQEKVSINSGYLHIDTGLLNFSTNSFSSRFLPYSVGIPTTGYWRRGQVLLDTSGNPNIAGYVCVTTGSPGDWRIIPTFQSSETMNNLAVRSLQPTELFYPKTDNTVSVGTSVNRFSLVYAATGTINTSDERYKTLVTTPSDDLLKAWGDVEFKVFKFKDSVTEKGTESARYHIGVVAQDVQKAFSERGIDATKYGLFCYDEWQDKFETVEVIDSPERIDEKGNLIPAVTHTEQKKVISAGDRYGIRYEEALALECAYLRSRLDKLEKEFASKVML